MTEQERRLVEDLIARVRNAPPPQIDPEALTLIRQGLGTRPDALYILVQTVLLQEMALNEARDRSQGPSFPGGEGRGYDARYEQRPSRFSGFLQNAAQTAAGVLAGEVAFSALASLFGGHHAGYGSGFLGGGGGETIVNNYYGGNEGEHPLSPGLSPDLEDRRFAGSDDLSSDVGDDLADDFADDFSSGDSTDL